MYEDSPPTMHAAANMTRGFATSLRSFVVRVTSGTSLPLRCVVHVFGACFIPSILAYIDCCFYAVSCTPIISVALYFITETICVQPPQNKPR